MAATSHAIQLAAVAIGSALAAGRSDKQLQQSLQLSGPALASFSRLMASPSRMWLDIIDLNKEHTVDALSRLIDELGEIRRSICSNDSGSLSGRFAEAQRVHAGLDKI